MQGLSTLLFQLGREEEAKVLCREALGIARDVVGVYHPLYQEARATAKRRRHEVAAELQKVKESREKGEREREAWEAEKRQLDKELEQMAFADNQRREDEFQLQQERSRAVRRVEEGRARLVDLLTAGLSLLESDAAPSELLPNEVPDPLAVFEHSSEAELRELQGEISRHSDLDSGNADFWAAMGLVCDDALQASSGDTTVTAEVRGEIDAMLDGKSPAELDELQGQIVELARQDTNADYWGAVLARLRLVRARAVLSGATVGCGGSGPMSKPRRYFNRVHTGYEWNKYNQTHYDHDNPPPKMVQGYKFNVFYPDLIDRRKTPTYSLSPDPGSSDTCILRFHGAPPLDIAFKIVNQEWETNHKRGFRCRFERGILQLYFNFKRHRYRR
ncbi:hypothetical protein EMIHUDRAFT_461772 [Emiliania huxleyi CCMP1516]|uniref:Splicing factor Cactin n=2 Tax=Emiliania huxleyi TaxID=2903 RepID=A0A0D3IE44_EMIH1|nr:hypothetical protein EMIHUDRAFT_461772 [Emiliania huxleyi CCMP1516]EOD09529.1 hypothetical protein EMIHUDRAFT_461772 [Emiliania huxleyi CCMP1516]|eukprot:XP_005761958.1 hypothetical protein EMIHUDRAFT_461772 [Emiliania huxleyi CCMP1516]